MAKPPTPIAHRLMRRRRVVATTNCWLWTGDTTGFGHGRLYRAETKRKECVHRVAYEHFIGPTNGLSVLHRCDVPACFNPDHLFLGTHQDNMTDMVNKRRGKTRRGEENNMAKLNRSIAAEIRATPRRHGVVSSLARKHGVSRKAIRLVMDGVA